MGLLCVSLMQRCTYCKGAISNGRDDRECVVEAAKVRPVQDVVAVHVLGPRLELLNERLFTRGERRQIGNGRLARVALWNIRLEHATDDCNVLVPLVPLLGADDGELGA